MNRPKKLAFFPRIYQTHNVNLLKSFKTLHETDNELTLHLVGKILNDSYFKSVENEIISLKLEKAVFFYGMKTDIENIIKQATVGVLSSSSEGLPVSILEYGLAGLPMVTTDVGDCKIVVNNEKYVVPPKDSKYLATAIGKLLYNSEELHYESIRLKKRVQVMFSFDAYIEKLSKLYL